MIFSGMGQLDDFMPSFVATAMLGPAVG